MIRKMLVSAALFGLMLAAAPRPAHADGQVKLTFHTTISRGDSIWTEVWTDVNSYDTGCYKRHIEPGEITSVTLMVEPGQHIALHQSHHCYDTLGSFAVTAPDHDEEYEVSF